MISQSLEISLHMAFVNGRQKRQEFITVEDLLLCLLDNPDANPILAGCGANVETLRTELISIAPSIPPVKGRKEVDTKPTIGFQRAIQRAINARPIHRLG